MKKTTFLLIAMIMATVFAMAGQISNVTIVGTNGIAVNTGYYKNN